MKDNRSQRIITIKQKLNERMNECAKLSKNLSVLIKQEWPDSDTEHIAHRINQDISLLIYQLNEAFENDGGDEL